MSLLRSHLFLLVPAPLVNLRVGEVRVGFDELNSVFGPLFIVDEAFLLLLLSLSFREVYKISELTINGKKSKSYGGFLN